MLKFVWFLSIILAIPSCKTTVDQESVTQGITGQVLWIEGNQMPGPERTTDPGKAVKREIVIYEALTLDEVEGSMPLFDNIGTEPVKVFKTTDNGKFTIDLLPGTYSIFTREENGQLFANSSDGDGVINPVVVNKNELTELIIKINYNAAY